MVFEELTEEGVAEDKIKLKDKIDAFKLEPGIIKVANKKDSVNDDDTSVLDAGKGEVNSDNNLDWEI